MQNLPWSTAELPGIGGVIRQRAEDFFVQEIPAYEPCGEGEHVYAEIQKIHLGSFEAVQRLATALEVPTGDIGYAGMKDARALTRQVFSISGTTPERVMALKLPNLEVLWASRHTNKLRLGHLRGNRFAIKVREVEPTHAVRAQAIVRQLGERGMPNFFGEQRFGRRGNNHLLGAALVAGDSMRVLKLLLGDPQPGVDNPRTMRARQAFEAHDNEEAMAAFPRNSGLERRILARLMKTHKPTATVRGIDQRLRRLWISALQSRAFNDVLIRRMDSFGTLLAGDLAEKHENGAVFRVEDVDAEQPRAAAFEISPTGPLIGYRMTEPGGVAGEIEHEVFASYGLQREAFRQSERLRVKGARRALRVRPTDIELSAGVDEHGGYIVLAFTLPAGSFATVLMGEVMKTEPEPEPVDGPADDEEPGDDEPGGDPSETAEGDTPETT